MSETEPRHHTADDATCPGLKSVMGPAGPLIMRLNFRFEWMNMAPSLEYFYHDGAPPMTLDAVAGMESAVLAKFATAFPADAGRVYKVTYLGFFPMMLTPAELTAEGWRVLPT